MTKNTLKIYVCLSNPTAAMKWESPKKSNPTDCLHPKCRSGADKPRWGPSGPKMEDVMLVPVALPITTCTKTPCNGHYANNPTVLAESKVTPVPSVLVQKAFGKFPQMTEKLMSDLASRALLNACLHT